MTRKDRPVAERQKSLEPVPPEAHITLAGVRDMYAGMGAKSFIAQSMDIIEHRFSSFRGSISIRTATSLTMRFMRLRRFERVSLRICWTTS